MFNIISLKENQDTHYKENCINITTWDIIRNESLFKNLKLYRQNRSVAKRIYARNTVFKEIDNKTADEFLNQFHIQGTAKGSFSYGLYYGKELVAVSKFKMGATNTSNKGKIELIRHSTSYYYIVIGALGKIISNYKKLHSENLYTFCDIGLFTGKSYELAGFEKVGSIAPDYRYFKDGRVYHKFNFRKNEIAKKFGIDMTNKTENEAMQELGYNKLWDLGKVRYEIIQKKHRCNTKEQYKGIKKAINFKYINTSTKVKQYSLDNEYIATFNSIGEASKLTNTDRSAISKVCLGKRTSAGGYIWKYENEKEVLKELTKVQRPKQRVYIKLDDNKQELARYTKKDLVENGYNYDTIRKASKRNGQSFGYYWSIE